MIPKTIRQPLERQSLSVLRETLNLIEHLIREKENPTKPEELVSRREVLEVKESGSVTYRLERVSCGKNCKGCPHGPYWYGYWREGGRTRSKYIGKSLSGMKKLK